VGGNAQTKAMKKVAGKLRLDLSQYRDLEAFAQFGSELDPETRKSLARGERLVEMLNQKERQPLSVSEQVASIYAGTGGYLDRIKVERVQEFLERMLELLHSEQSELMDGIDDDGQLSDEREEALGSAIADFVDDFGPDFDDEGQPLEEGESDRVKSEEERERPARSEESGGDEDSDDGDDEDDGDSDDADADAEGKEAEEGEKEAAPA
jgi:F-type H+/Na+-transporting ATPase subunit alpha